MTSIAGGIRDYKLNLRWMQAEAHGIEFPWDGNSPLISVETPHGGS
jgi:hypothetical protein